MAGNISISAGAAPAQSRTSVSGGFRLPAQPAPAPQVPAGYQLVYRMGGPRYMYGETPEFGARYGDGRTVPGQIYGNMRGSREGADMFGFFPTMFQSQPYATASQMYTPSLGVMPLIGYPSKYPHVIMGGYTDYGAPIANQAISMMLPLLMMGLYRQMFPPMMPQAPAAGAGAGGGKKGGGGGGSGGGSGGSTEASKTSEPANPLVPPAMQPTPDLLGIALRGLPGNYAGANGRAFFTEQTPQFGDLQVPHTAESLGASRQAPAGLAPKSGEAASRQYELLFGRRRAPVQEAAPAAAPASGGGAVDAPVEIRDPMLRNAPRVVGRSKKYGDIPNVLY